MPLPMLCLRDWEDFGDKDLPVYFEKAHAIFLRRLEHMRDLDRSLTEREEKELRFMLDAVIAGKQALRGRTDR